MDSLVDTGQYVPDHAYVHALLWHPEFDSSSA